MTSKPSPLSRRDFLRLTAAGLGSLAAGPIMSACSQNPATATATAVPATAAPATATPTLVRRPLSEVMKFFPTVPSRVIQTHLPGVWSDKNLVPGALRKMLDASITRLTGLNDAREAWAALFKPGERIVIKVNTFSNSLIWTHVPLVTAVTESLQEAGMSRRSRKACRKPAFLPIRSPFLIPRLSN